MYAVTNALFPNRIQLVCTPYVGPFTQTFTTSPPTSPPTVDFDPRLDLDVYVDGTLIPVNNFVFDPANNRYLLFMNQIFNLQGVIQVLYHIPNPPFAYSPPLSPPLFPFVPAFAMIASYNPDITAV